MEIHHCSGVKAAITTNCSQAMTKHSKGRLFPGRWGLIEWVALAQELPQSLAKLSLEISLANSAVQGAFIQKLSFLYPSLKVRLAFYFAGSLRLSQLPSISSDIFSGIFLHKNPS